MPKNTFRILFYIKRTKKNKLGEVPVFLRITIRGKSRETSLQRSIMEEMWDVARNKAKGCSKEAQALNSYLSSIRGQLYTIQQKKQERNQVVSAVTMMQAFKGEDDENRGLIALFEEHNKRISELIGQDYSKATLTRYKTTLAYVKEHLLKVYQVSEMYLNELNHAYLTSFEHFLKTNKACIHNSAMKHVKGVKKIVRYAFQCDLIPKDPFVHFKVTTKETHREFLTTTELEALMQTPIHEPELALNRDLFVFQCYTGLAFVDLQNLKKEHIQTGIDASPWIIMKRTKTDTECRIPLLPVPLELIQKYSIHSEVLVSGKLLPVPTNVKMNTALKTIASLCGISKNLHTHLGRHTFASTVTLTNGISIEAISKMLGHKKLQTTQIYAKVADVKISAEMGMLREMLG